MKPVSRGQVRQAVEDALSRRLDDLKERDRTDRLEEQVSDQAAALACRVRELTALNNMIQADLSSRFDDESFGPDESWREAAP